MRSEKQNLSSLKQKVKTQITQSNKTDPVMSD